MNMFFLFNKNTADDHTISSNKMMTNNHILNESYTSTPSKKVALISAVSITMLFGSFYVYRVWKSSCIKRKSEQASKKDSSINKHNHIDTFLKKYPLDMSLCETKIRYYRENSQELDNIMNSHRNNFIQCDTPLGIVFMTVSKDTFTYWSDNSIPTSFLEVVARKYVTMMDAMDVYALSIYYNRRNNEDVDEEKHMNVQEYENDEDYDLFIQPSTKPDNDKSTKKNDDEIKSKNMVCIPVFRRMGKIRDMNIFHQSKYDEIYDTTSSLKDYISYNYYRMNIDSIPELECENNDSDYDLQ